MAKIICTISPKTVDLKGIDVARINGAFGSKNDIRALIRKARLGLDAKVLLDLPGRRKKKRTNSYSDSEIIDIAKKERVDFIGISYVDSPKQIDRVRRRLKGFPIDIVAKMETRKAFEDADSIIKAADVIMIDRGDMADAIGFTSLPRAQKRIIRKCNQFGCSVIVATELLKSMVSDSKPSKAEILDIANAVSDGADYLMLSEETALGDYPQHAVDVLRELINETSDNYKIIILTAGENPMMGALTANSNVSLIDIGGESILESQLKALHRNGIHDEDIIVATGKADLLIKRQLAKTDIQTVFNPWYNSTNMLTTIWLAKDKLKDGFIVIYGDVVFEPEILKRLITNKNDIVMAVEQKACDEEDEKLCVKDGHMILHPDYNKFPEPRHKCMPLKYAYGEFIGMAKFNRLGAGLLIKAMDRIMNKRAFDTYLMTAFETLVKEGLKINIERINGFLWNDNDTMYDLRKTRREIFPEIRKRRKAGKGK